MLVSRDEIIFNIMPGKVVSKLVFEGIKKLFLGSVQPKSSTTFLGSLIKV